MPCWGRDVCAERAHERLDPVAISAAKSCRLQAVEIEDTIAALAGQQRDDELRSRVDVAGDVTRKRCHVIDDDGRSRPKGSATDAGARCESGARRLASEGAKYEIARGVGVIEAGPTHIWNLLKEQRCEVRSISKMIALTGDELTDLPLQQFVVDASL